jgi:hypothetical protein
VEQVPPVAIRAQVNPNELPVLSIAASLTHSTRLPVFSGSGPTRCGTWLADSVAMDKKNPNRGAPQGDESEPLGDLGERGETWSPEQGEQGISNRVGDKDPEAEDASDPSKD